MLINVTERDFNVKYLFKGRKAQRSIGKQNFIAEFSRNDYVKLLDDLFERYLARGEEYNIAIRFVDLRRRSSRRSLLHQRGDASRKLLPG